MSHVTTLRTRMKEEAELVMALKDLGFATRREKEWLVVLPSAPRLNIPIYFRKVGDAYDLVADWPDIRGITRDQFLGQVSQRYAYHVHKRELEARGFEVRSEEARDGTIRLILGRSVIKQIPKFAIEAHEVESRIDKDGEVSVTVRGMKGLGCLDATRDLEAALGGTIIAREMTAEALSGESSPVAEEVERGPSR